MIGAMQPPPIGTPPVLAPRRRPTEWWWFLIPLCTFGMGTFIMVLIGGVRLRSRLHISAAVGYFLLTAYFFIGTQYTATDTQPDAPLPSLAIMPAFLIIWLGGIAHVLVMQMKIRALGPMNSGSAWAFPGALGPTPGASGAATAAGPVQLVQQGPRAEPAIAVAQWRIQRRHAAREILAGNPALAAELRIGRPDLPRQYDDGGLVDVNHVPAAILVRELDIPAEVAAHVVAERDRLGGFSGADELLVYCEGITPERLRIIQDRLVFVAL